MQAVTAMEAVTALAPGGGLRAASCAALGLSRASLHRRQSARQRPPAGAASAPLPERDPPRGATWGSPNAGAFSI